MKNHLTTIAVFVLVGGFIALSMKYPALPLVLIGLVSLAVSYAGVYRLVRDY